MDRNEETANAAKVILGMLECGTLSTDKYVKTHLTKILKQWIMRCESTHELSEPERLYDSFTPTERKYWELLSMGRVVRFQLLSEGKIISEDAVEKVLKNIRKKLDRRKFNFAISRARAEVQWLVRDGKQVK